MSESQKTLVQLLAEGLCTKEIAAKLMIGERAVEYRSYLLRQEYEAKNTTHLIAILMRKKIIQ